MRRQLQLAGSDRYAHAVSAHTGHVALLFVLFPSSSDVLDQQQLRCGVDAHLRHPQLNSDRRALVSDGARRLGRSCSLPSLSLPLPPRSIANSLAGVWNLERGCDPHSSPYTPNRSTALDACTIAGTHEAACLVQVASSSTHIQSILLCFDAFYSVPDLDRSRWISISRAGSLLELGSLLNPNSSCACKAPLDLCASGIVVNVGRYS